MNIAFWSNIGGKNGVTSNLAGVSILSALEQRFQSILFENHCHINSIEKAFVRRKTPNLIREEEQYFYNHVGIDSLMKRLHSKMHSKNMMENASLDFLDKSIYYIPQSNLANKEVFEYEFNQIIHPLLDQANEFAKVVLMDIAGCSNLSTQVILSKADLVVVNLSQDPQIINHFFENFSSLSSKAVYLLGNYNHNSKYNLTNIRRKFQINKEQIAVVPYNIAYKDALIEGDAISFLLRNYNCKKEDDNYYFMKELKKATKMISKKIDEHNNSVEHTALGA